ncbi:ribbon-helix-helix domain-containing protein [Natronobacterium texcoconense]|uniref:Transcriptional regulator, contains Arc/MetJ-type RHH (Ribbon-helix-helix) DNA-binding domain n=1 Tax=Natronobacterium texcoconense TaxID=1095778 RepID=A0A1H1HV23_NATTX|nr:transcriptional regulator [Natronobacterium texcoconense]SDR29297.1 Transcriptional regulator, contains Arc/MetJ-type RHH (ribbon-helix-helix) DNA-binding domain [Natronobacterium texcoconense]
MVKSTVRFPEEVMALVQAHTDEGEFTNKSEFQRFAVEYLLTELEDDYEPTLTQFDEIRESALEDDDPEPAEFIQTAEPSEFLRTASRVRQCAVRGDVETAYELIDTRHPPESPKAMLLDLIVQGVTSDEQE